MNTLKPKEVLSQNEKVAGLKVILELSEPKAQSTCSITLNIVVVHYAKKKKKKIKEETNFMANRRFT